MSYQDSAEIAKLREVLSEIEADYEIDDDFDRFVVSVKLLMDTEHSIYDDLSSKLDRLIVDTEKAWYVYVNHKNSEIPVDADLYKQWSITGDDLYYKYRRLDGAKSQYFKMVDESLLKVKLIRATLNRHGID